MSLSVRHPPRLPVPLILSLICMSAAAQTAPAPEASAAARGQRLFLRCASCHDITGSGAARNGPPLRGVVGRQVASVAGYGYSESLARQNFVWDEARLDAWLERPPSIAPGTAMAFEGMPAAADRRAVIAYLKTLAP